jgi:hypothetical protein
MLGMRHDIVKTWQASSQAGRELANDSKYKVFNSEKLLADVK